jgi:hypothetical protein
VHLAALRNPKTGRYEHYGLYRICGEDEADPLLRESHEETFAQWLCCGLRKQKADVDLYLSSLNVDRQSIMDTWNRLAPYRNLMPTSAGEIERRLYLADVEGILSLLRNQYCLPGPNRELRCRDLKA